MIIDDLDGIIAKLPGIIGSAGALYWLKGPWTQKIVLFLLGVAASVYGTHDFARFTGLSEGLSGFIVGMFSMYVADWLFNNGTTMLSKRFGKKEQ